MARKKDTLITTTEDNQRILALDIGTRSIVGVILEKDQGVSIKAVEYLEHETRAMFDGQIHDVETVAAEIAIIKERLEEITGEPLHFAAVAAAGRALKTARGQAVFSRPSTEEIIWEEISAMELEAVQQAQINLIQSTQGVGEYFCVGHSVINFYLEGQPLQNLAGQMGKEIAVEVIATFLPRVVVDSLFSALKKAGLEISSLTLEPIAALAAAIPPSMRLLNLALVDIGAGTSDIAVVNKGTISSYAMVPMGGDEITEALGEKYLLDFNVAENIKRRLASSESLTFVDVLENTITTTASETIELLTPTIRDLANRIAYEIMTINRKTPDAVVCVGGGSLTPTLLKELADALEMPVNKIGTRTREAIAHVKGDFLYLTGPSAVTPIGIGLNALNSRPLPIVRIKINDREIPLWGLNEVTVGSALLSSGLNLNSIYGLPGLGLTVEINGLIKIIPGEIGSPPVIKVNGEPAGIDTPLIEGDHVEFTRGYDGQHASIRLGDLIESSPGIIYLNGSPLEMPSLVLVNGEEKPLDYMIPDRARIENIQGQPIEVILAQAGIDPRLLQPQVIHYSVNGENREYTWRPCRVTINGGELAGNEMVAFEARIEYKLNHQEPRLKDVVDHKKVDNVLKLIVNDKPLELPGDKVTLRLDGVEADMEEPLRDHAEIMVNHQVRQMILSDVLSHVTIQSSKSGRLILRVNGSDAGFVTPIHDGDTVEIKWEDL
ncbi:MAG: cell division FtsA domain-containing protein [Ignavibacteriales bacterium]